MILNRHGERLDAVFTPGRGCVVIAHGLTSHKDRPWLVALADALSAAGVGTLRFSFSGNGASEGRFEDSTISKEVDDLGAVLDAVGEPIVYAGHSMGAAVGVIRAKSDPRIHALVSLAGMIRVHDFMMRHLVPDRGVMFGKPHCPLTQAFLDDARRVGVVPPVRVPWRLVHGTADEMVPIEEARAAGGDLVELPGVDHRFTGAHDAMAAAVVPWVSVR